MAVITIQTRLDEARIALHALLIGGAVVSVTDQNGEKVEYNRMSISALKMYIQELEAQLGVRKPARPLKFWM